MVKKRTQGRVTEYELSRERYGGLQATSIVYDEEPPYIPMYGQSIPQLIDTQRKYLNEMLENMVMSSAASSFKVSRRKSLLLLLEV